MQNDPAVVQARIDKLLARISTLETANRELQEAAALMREKMSGKEKELREAQEANGYLAARADLLNEEIEEQDSELASLHAHMDELRDILLKDNDAQTVLDALRHLTRKAKK